ncbi:hypothetical protein [Streptomyces violascens]|uniref:hypothetical protein n=1 Tax=Streptomyces violascens TaxID=67381 RepID=UPI0036B6A8A6
MSRTVQRTLAAGALAAGVAVLVTVVALGGPARDPAGPAALEKDRIALFHDVLRSHDHWLNLPQK